MVDQNRRHNSTSQRLRFVLTILALYKFVCMYVCMSTADFVFHVLF